MPEKLKASLKKFGEAFFYLWNFCLMLFKQSVMISEFLTLFVEYFSNSRQRFMNLFRPVLISASIKYSLPQLNFRSL